MAENYINLFGVPIGEFTLSEINLSSLIEYCYKLNREDPEGRLISNEGGWQSNEVQDEPHAEIQKLIEEIEECAQKMHDELGFIKELSQKVSAMWININQKGDRNMIHFHDRSIFSGVFYLQTKAKLGDGSLSFRSPNYMTMSTQWLSHRIIDNHGSETSSGWQMWHPAGNLVIFPGWLEHEVLPHNSEEDRISISFNTWVPKEITGPDNIAWYRPLNTNIN